MSAAPNSQIIKGVDILGVTVSAVNLATTLEVIESWIASRISHYVCVTGVHGIMESYRDPELMEIHNRAGLVTPDGMPLVWLSRRTFPYVGRVYGPDLVLALCARSQDTGYRHFFYGATVPTLSTLQRRLICRFPKLNIVGTFSPPFRSPSLEEDGQIVARIKAAKPDVLWVGLSTPKQERWMANHVEKLGIPALIGVGAAFDFHAGVKRQAPLWMQRSGLEWTFRLATEPRRLWRRYLTNNPAFVYLILLDTFRRGLLG
ncbi:MAG: WecB/TagA/CpsF family glycosyltransferase [Candidatus Binataceae bacterium]